MRKVLAFGTFDYLHPGHVHFLREAKRLGTHLSVIVSRDATVRKVKKAAPSLDEQARLSLLKEMKAVDEAFLGEEEDIYACLKKIRPDIIALGYDQQAFVDGLAERLVSLGLQTKIVRLKSFAPAVFKSTKIKKQQQRGGEEKDAKMFIVPLAIIVHNGKVFLQQRNDPGTVNHRKWEFPGGSVEWGETPEECLIREVKEETSYRIKVLRLLPKIFTNYRVYDWGRVQIVLMPYICTLLPSQLKVASREVLRTGWYTFPHALRKQLLPKNDEMLQLAEKIIGDWLYD